MKLFDLKLKSCMDTTALFLRDHRGVSNRIMVVMDNDGLIQNASFDCYPRLAICGKGGCGKDTVAEWLAKNTILRYDESTSKMALPFVFARMLELGYNYYCPSDCYEDRRNHRKVWAELIDEYNADDHARLYRERIQNSDILTGIRKRRELLACKKEGIVQLRIWIERLLCPPDESLDYGPEECDMIITNNEGVPELHQKLWNIFATFGILKE